MNIISLFRHLYCYNIIACLQGRTVLGSVENNVVNNGQAHRLQSFFYGKAYKSN